MGDWFADLGAVLDRFSYRRNSWPEEQAVGLGCEELAELGEAFWAVPSDMAVHNFAWGSPVDAMEPVGGSVRQQAANPAKRIHKRNLPVSLRAPP